MKETLKNKAVDSECYSTRLDRESNLDQCSLSDRLRLYALGLVAALAPTLGCKQGDDPAHPDASESTVPLATNEKHGELPPLRAESLRYAEGSLGDAAFDLLRSDTDRRFAFPPQSGSARQVEFRDYNTSRISAFGQHNDVSNSVDELIAQARQDGLDWESNLRSYADDQRKENKKDSEARLKARQQALKEFYSSMSKKTEEDNESKHTRVEPRDIDSSSKNSKDSLTQALVKKDTPTAPHDDVPPLIIEPINQYEPLEIIPITSQEAMVPDVPEEKERALSEEMTFQQLLAVNTTLREAGATELTYVDQDEDKNTTTFHFRGEKDGSEVVCKVHIPTESLRFVKCSATAMDPFQPALNGESSFELESREVVLDSSVVLSNKPLKDWQFYTVGEDGSMLLLKGKDSGPSVSFGWKQDLNGENSGFAASAKVRELTLSHGWSTAPEYQDGKYVSSETEVGVSVGPKVGIELGPKNFKFALGIGIGIEIGRRSVDHTSKSFDSDEKNNQEH